MVSKTGGIVVCTQRNAETRDNKAMKLSLGCVAFLFASILVLGVEAAPAAADTSCPPAPPSAEEIIRAARTRTASDRWTGLARRARNAHWLPRLSLSLRRSLGSDAAARLYTDHDQLVTSREDGFVFEAQLVFDLGQVVYAADEPVLTQREVERLKAIDESERDALDAYATYVALRQRCLRGIVLGADEEIRLTRAGLTLLALTQ